MRFIPIGNIGFVGVSATFDGCTLHAVFTQIMFPFVFMTSATQMHYHLVVRPLLRAFVKDYAIY